MHGSHEELSVVLDSIRNLEYNLACVGDFECCRGLTSSHGQATAAERGLNYDVEYCRAQARALASALADLNNCSLASVRAIAIDIGNRMDSAAANAHILNSASKSLKRAHILANTIKVALDGAPAFGVFPTAAVDVAGATAGHGNISDRTPSESLRKKSRPPVWAESILALLASGKPDEALGDFRERFNLTIEKDGLFWAQIDYLGGMLRSVPGFLRIKLRGNSRE